MARGPRTEDEGGSVADCVCERHRRTYGLDEGLSESLPTDGRMGPTDRMALLPGH